ncbi:hypothetical protein E2C01_041050 [Portunus trituberculatus]|uniref:Uncharacterized protein n=1 Tax=Portunus trituberculatus TaxID=210409 RepID=A0A5B7FPM2_PORTR|nr:hypothetical protein [Portunus trituberculatus]
MAWRTVAWARVTRAEVMVCGARWAPASHLPGGHMSHRHVTVDARMEDLVYLDRGYTIMSDSDDDCANSSGFPV